MGVADYQAVPDAPAVAAGEHAALHHAPGGALPASEEPAPSKWSTGLFEFGAQPGGSSLQWVAHCLPWVSYGTLAHTMPEDSTCGAGRFGWAAASYLSLEILAGLTHCLVVPGISLIPMSACLNMKMRKSLRSKYNIEGDGRSDFCVSWWCAPCAIAQQTREVIIRNAAEQAQQQKVEPVLAAPAAPTHMFGHLLLVPDAQATAAGMPVPAVIGQAQKKAGYEPYKHG